RTSSRWSVTSRRPRTTASRSRRATRTSSPRSTRAWPTSRRTASTPRCTRSGSAKSRRATTEHDRHESHRLAGPGSAPRPACPGKEPLSRFLQFHWLGVVDYLPALLQGLYYTLLISVVGLIIGFILGAIFGLGRISRSKILYGISAVYVEVLRGTPVLVQAIWIYFALPLIIGFNIPSLAAGIIVIGLNSGAYIAEIVRGAVQSVE